MGVLDVLAVEGFLGPQRCQWLSPSTVVTTDTRIVWANKYGGRFLECELDCRGADGGRLLACDQGIDADKWGA